MSPATACTIRRTSGAAVSASAAVSTATTSEPKSAIGIDLSTAVEDVQTRFGRTLDDFLREPTGTMSVVLSRQIVLSPEEKQVAIGKLREAFAEHQKQKAGEARLNPGQVIESRH